MPEAGETESQFPVEDAVALQLSDPPPVFCTWKVWLDGFDPWFAEKAIGPVLTESTGAATTDNKKVALALATDDPLAVIVTT